MSILTEPLPEALDILGTVYPIHWDHRTMLRIDELLTEELSDDERGAEILTLFYGEIPDDVETTTEAMIWFFRCGKGEKEETEGGKDSAPVRPDFSYQLDADLIYAAFLDQYGVDLATEDLHWWKFRALFDALKPDHVFSEVRKCRSIRITRDMTPEQKKYYKAMKKLYALPRPEQQEIDDVTAALMGDGNVMGVLYGSEDR